MGACALALAGFALAAEVPVALGPEGPQPATVTVNWGDTVAFTNADSEAHGIQIPRATVTSPDIPPSGTFLQVFDQAKGTFGFVQTGTKRRSGQIVVEVRGELSLQAAPETVVFGKQAVLSGMSPYPNTPVVITYRRLASQEQTALHTVTAAEDGAYATSFPPQFSSRLQASAAAGQLRSAVATVKVAPLLTIAARPQVQSTGRTVTVTGQIAPADAAKTVELLRYNAKRETWERVDTEPVSRSGAVTFRWKAEKGRSLLRLGVGRADLQLSYEPARSRWVAVKGIEPPR